MSQAQRDSLAVGNIEKFLDNQLTSKRKAHPSTLKAIEIRYARLRPTLSATELSQPDNEAKLDENQLLSKLATLIQAHPDLVQRALAAHAKQAQALPSVAINEDERVDAPQHTGDTLHNVG